MSQLRRLLNGGRLVGLVAGLGVAVVGLAVALGVTLADDENGTHDAGPGYPGMMMAMGSMDTGVMLKRMKEVLGPDDFQKLMGHMRDGMPQTSDPQIDQLMHRMMDSMLAEMPMDSTGQMPAGGHHPATPPAK